jgi:hypothetical protein
MEVLQGLLLHINKYMLRHWKFDSALKHMRKTDRNGLNKSEATGKPEFVLLLRRDVISVLCEIYNCVYFLRVKEQSILLHVSCQNRPIHIDR